MRMPLLVGIGLIAPPAPAVAQEGFDWGSVMSAYAHGDAMVEAAGESVPAVRTRKAAPPKPPAEVKLTFTPSPERRRRNLAAITATMRANSAAGAAQFEQILRQNDLFGCCRRRLPAMG